MDEPKTDGPRRWTWPRAMALVLALLLVLLAACETIKPIDDDPTKIIIPETTRVADADTRAALMSFDPDSGQLRFRSDTDFLRDLRPDDVLVSEPSEAAPYGYLLRVHEVQRFGDEVLVETSQASLLDAIHQADVDFDEALDPAQMLEPIVFFEGVSVSATPGDAAWLRDWRAGGAIDFAALAEGSLPPMGTMHGEEGFGAGAPDGALQYEGLNFRVVLDRVHAGRAFEGGSAQVSLNGELRFSAGVRLGVAVKPCWTLVCLRRFEAAVGFEQVASVHISGTAGADFDSRLRVAHIPFTPYTIWIGPVPVVLVPSVDVYVGVEGDVYLQVDYGIRQRAFAELGARYTDSRGWEDISGSGLEVDEYRPVTVEAGFRLGAYAQAEAKLLLYGIIGPGLALKGGVTMDVAFRRNPFWSLGAYIAGDVSFNFDIPIVGNVARYSKEIFRWSTPPRESPNAPPELRILRAELRYPVRQAPQLHRFYWYDDREDGRYANVTLTSSRAGDQMASVEEQGFQTVGTRTITVTVRDSRGATAVGTIQVEVYNPPPVVYAGFPGGTTRQSAPPPGYLIPVHVNVGAADPVDGRLPCSSVVVAVDAPDTVQRIDHGQGNCEAIVHFYAQGTRPIRIHAVDQDGTSSQQRTYGVSVIEPPQFPPPVIDGGLRIYGFTAHSPYLYSCYGQLRELPFSVVASDPTGFPLSYSWTLRHQTVDTRYMDITGGILPAPWGLVAEAGGASMRFPSASNPVPDLTLGTGIIEYGKESGPWIVRLEVSNGETTVFRSVTFAAREEPCNPR